MFVYVASCTLLGQTYMSQVIGSLCTSRCQHRGEFLEFVKQMAGHKRCQPHVAHLFLP